MWIDPFSKRLLQNVGQHGPLTLMYHAISAQKSKPQWPWAITLSQFIEHLDILKTDGWTTITASQLNEPTTLNPKSVLITFDDGYADNYAAFAALAERHMKASWFIVSNDIGKHANWATKSEPSLPLLSADQLREMADHGMSIGSHTCSHCRLPEVDTVKLNQELLNSKQALQDLLGQEVTEFAYPYGLYNDSIIEAVRSAGYKSAFTTQSGWTLTDSDPFRLRRITLYANDTASSFIRKLAFADNNVSWKRLSSYYSHRVKDKFFSGKAL